MFNRKKCPRCREKVPNNSKFCPYCGISLKENTKDYGMLGRDDFIEENEFSFPFGGISGKMINKMFGSAMRMLEKEMQKEMNRVDSEERPRTNFKLMINGREIPLNQPTEIKRHKKIKTIQLPSNLLKGFSKLPKQEPKTNVRRLADKVIYEIEIPGVKSLDDISVTKLENSIEIKALSKDKAYLKIIPINLPIVDYYLEKTKLVLEIDTKN